MEIEAKYKKDFELLNNLWQLLKPLVMDENEYKKIMSESFKIFMFLDKSEKKFTEEWWNVATKDFLQYPEKFKETEYKEFAADMGLSFCDFWEKEKKRTVNHLDFYKSMSMAFVHEWERLKG